MCRHGALSPNGRGNLHVRHADAPRSIIGACHGGRTGPSGPVAFENSSPGSPYGRKGYAESEAPCLPRICASAQDRTEGESCSSEQQFPDHSSRVDSRLAAAKRLNGPDGPSSNERHTPSRPAPSRAPASSSPPNSIDSSRDACISRRPRGTPAPTPIAPPSRARDRGDSPPLDGAFRGGA